MAMSEEIKQQRETLKGKGIGAYLTYFKDYYLLRTLVVIAAIWFIFTLVSNVLHAKTQVLGAYFLNAYERDNELAGSIEEDVSTYLDIDKNKETVMVDLSRFLQPGNQTGDSTGMTTQTVILTHIGAGMLDVMAADAENFNYYLDRGVYADLRDYLTEEELTLWEDRLIYMPEEEYRALMTQQDAEEQAAEGQTEAASEETTGGAYDALLAEMQRAMDGERVENYVRPDPQQMENPIPVGILIQDTELVKSTEMYDGVAAIAGIIRSSRHPENAAAFIRYLMTENGPE